PPPSSLERALNDTYKPLSRLMPPGYTPRLLHGLDAGLAVRPGERPQSIAEWRRHFAEPPEPDPETTIYVRRPTATFVPSPPAATAPPPPPPKPTFWPSSRGEARQIARVVGEAAVVLLLLSGGYWIAAVRPPPDAPPRITAVSSASTDEQSIERQRSE